jgi:hypothetical protein
MGLGKAPSRMRRQAVVLLRGTRSSTWGQDSNRVAEWLGSCCRPLFLSGTANRAFGTPLDVGLKAFNVPFDLTVTRAKLFGILRNLAIDVGPFQ